MVLMEDMYTAFPTMRYYDGMVWILGSLLRDIGNQHNLMFPSELCEAMATSCGAQCCIHDLLWDVGFWRTFRCCLHCGAEGDESDEREGSSNCFRQRLGSRCRWVIMSCRWRCRMLRNFHFVLLIMYFEIVEEVYWSRDDFFWRQLHFSRTLIIVGWQYNLASFPLSAFEVFVVNEDNIVLFWRIGMRMWMWMSSTVVLT